MEVNTSVVGDVVVIKLTGELTSRKDLAPVFWNHLHKDKNKFIINMSRVRTVNSVGLLTLLEFKRLTESAGGKVILCNLCDEVTSMLRTTRLDEVFTVIDDEDMALSGMIQGLPIPVTGSTVSRFRN